MTQLKGSHIVLSLGIIAKVTPCVVSEKNWRVKEIKGKSVMHALYALRLAKRHVLGRSNVEQ